jgi:heme A synthase
MADGFGRVAAPGRHTRQAERPGLRRVSVAALVMLVLQYGLGTVLNLYIEVPPADAHAGILTEIATAPLALTAHALLGVILIGTAILLVARAINRRERLLAVLAAAGLTAIGGAFLAGETFVKNGQNSASFAMAMLTGAALLCYIAILILTSGTRPAPEVETQPLLTAVPAARPRDLADYPDDWGAEPGWDDDPDWAGRLRREADPGWPERPGWAQRPGGRPAGPPSGSPGGWFTPE